MWCLVELAFNMLYYNIVKKYIPPHCFFYRLGYQIWYVDMLRGKYPWNTYFYDNLTTWWNLFVKLGMFFFDPFGAIIMKSLGNAQSDHFFLINLLKFSSKCFVLRLNFLILRLWSKKYKHKQKTLKFIIIWTHVY